MLCICANVVGYGSGTDAGSSIRRLVVFVAVGVWSVLVSRSTSIISGYGTGWLSEVGRRFGECVSLPRSSMVVDVGARKDEQ